MVQTEVYQVGAWDKDEDAPTYPVGSQPKELLICPAYLMQARLISGHRYLFKTPRGWQAYQLWSEVIAYHIGTLCGVAVPPAYVATDSNGQIGVLVEFFYGFPGAAHEDRFVQGSDILQRFIRDKKTGRPHGVRTNMTITRRYGVQDAVAAWGQLLAFDALIGNTDRHPENWGLVWRYQQAHLPIVSLAPAFDNATSLGYEQSEKRLFRFSSRAAVEKYISAGQHHCGWSQADDTRGGHIDVCVRYANAFPEAGEAMKNVVRFDMRDLERRLDELATIPASLPLSLARAQFVGDLVRARRDRLAAALGA
jgi:HipA-like C-terminal domain